MRQLFLVGELLDLGVSESDQEFQALVVLAALAKNRLVSRDSVVEITSGDGEGREKIEVLPIRWNRLRRHDFFSYADNLLREYSVVGVEGESPSPKPSLASGACPSGAPCNNDRCCEDGVCRRQGVDLISPCISDSHL